MMNIRKFFENLFASSKIGDEKLRKFVEIHIQRLIASNVGGKYDQLITAISAAYISYFETISDEDINSTLQKSQTLMANMTLEAFKQTLRTKEGTIRGTFEKDSPTYLEFFPSGLTEYSTANFLNAEVLMDRIISASTAHVAELGQPFVDLFTQLKTSFKAARTNQLKTIGEVKESKINTGVAREVVEIQLMKNILTLALEYLGNPDAGIAFFDQSIIRNPVPVPVEEDDNNIPPVPTPN